MRSITGVDARGRNAGVKRHEQAAPGAEVGPAERRRFEAVYQANYDAVLAYALARADVDTAKEVAADTFLVAWRRLSDLPVEPRAWLIGVARRVLADHRRSAGRRDALAERLAQRHVEVTPEPSDVVVTRAQVLSALHRLSASDQELLRLVAWDGLSSAEAAAVLGCTRAGLAVRLHRARRRFEAALRAGDPAPTVARLPEPRLPDPAVEPGTGVGTDGAAGDRIAGSPVPKRTGRTRG